ncbi:hypothetical protein KY290_018135 [Solanum tuberosum]|uniref:Uncharacterized protein n=1 Tax=Solanum tuberosum TaxID=4113 RepID=A0ABQ7VDB6_SOLTU|nr:hypothetical protein KY284_017076 [Solanum tuberosum]KAH0702829.1 hypothetical protein KY285_017107 [Solanum tuberosum]KAH0762062.1 hypothetical protein KY290_018135 [Solanum tuberosum]
MKWRHVERISNGSVREDKDGAERARTRASWARSVRYCWTGSVSGSSRLCSRWEEERSGGGGSVWYCCNLYVLLVGWVSLKMFWGGFAKKNWPKRLLNPFHSIQVHLCKVTIGKQ